MGQLRHGQDAGRGLAAGHSDVPVIQQFEGDVDLRRDAGLHGERPRMEVSAIAQILEDVFALAERRHADPGYAFATHLRGELIAAPGLGHQDSHAMTAGAAAGGLPGQEQRGAVVRTTGAEVRHAHRRRGTAG